ncbi:MAG: DUF6876 family protein [Nitrososphaerales archaeon]
MESSQEPDLELKSLGSFYGSEHYYRLMGGINATDGVHYVMENGYSWFVTDAAVILRLEPKVRGQDFVVVRLSLLPEGKAKVVYEDGNDNILFEQSYEWTNAKKELELFFADDVIMLASEY